MEVCLPPAGPNARGEPHHQPQRGTSGGWWCRLPGRADGYPSGPPTDPYVRNSRIRFLKQSNCCPCKGLPCSTVHWPAVVRVGALTVAPLSPASGGSARRRLPSRGSLGPHVPTFRGTMRRYDCRPAPLGVLHLSLVPRYRAGCRCSWCPVRARRLVEAPRRRQGLWSPGPLFRAWRMETGGSPTFPRSPSEDLPRSQTPVVSSALAKTHRGLLSSGACKPSAFLSVPP